MEEPRRADPEPPPPRRPSRWWRRWRSPSHRETRDGVGYASAVMMLGLVVGPVAGGAVGRALGRVGKDGYAESGFILGGMGGGVAVGLVAGVVSVVWGTSRLRRAVVLGLLLVGGVMLGGQVMFPPHR